MDRADHLRNLNAFTLLALAFGLLVLEIGKANQNISAEVDLASVGSIVSYEYAYIRLRVFLAAAVHAAAMWRRGLVRNLIGMLAVAVTFVEYGPWYWWTSRLGLVVGLSDEISMPLLPHGGTWLDLPLILTALLAVAFASGTIAKSLSSK